MASALETISGQAYGAQQYKKLGTQTYTAIFSLTLVCIPLSVLWTNMGKILVIIGQDPSISYEAGRFSTYLLPALFAYAVLQPLTRFFQSQSLVIPMVLSSCVTLCLHIPLCWALVFKSGLHNLGGAVALGLSNWLNVIFLALYMKFSSLCAATRSPLSMELFHGIGEFFRFAIPSAVMICLEWWSFELLILLSGLLPNPELETSVLSVTRVSNELGARNPQGARIAACGVMVIAVTNGVVISSVLFATRKVFGYTFSSDKQVVDYVTIIAPLVCLSVIVDSLQGVLSGIARGCGWQHIGAYVNLAAFYVFGIPIASTLAFWLQMKGRGLWIGVLTGATLQTSLLMIITICTNWEDAATKAWQRVSNTSYKGTNVDEERLLLA
ncbi:Protein DETOXIFICATION 12 [Bienertia sinuspersici]